MARPVPLTSPRAPRRRGFTLIELLVVILILATIAGLVISRVDWVQGAAESSTSAAGMIQVQNNLQLYRTNKRELPNGFDSLVVDPAGTPAIYTAIFGEQTGSTLSWLNPTTLVVPTAGSPTNSAVYSLSKLGMSRVYDHVATASVPNNSAQTERAFSISDTVDDVVATVDITSFIGARIAQSLYPQLNPVVPGPPVPGVLPAGVTLVAFGVGPNCSAVGTTMTSAPISPSSDPNTFYARYIAVFAAYDDGRSAQLKAVVDSSGSVVGDQLQNYYQSSPE